MYDENLAKYTDLEKEFKAFPNKLCIASSCKKGKFLEFSQSISRVAKVNAARMYFFREK